MLSDPDQFLNRLVVAALTVFITVSLLVAAFVFREIWLQQRISNLSITLQDNLTELEQTTEEIQGELSAIQTITTTAQQAENLGNVTDLLTDANQQLESIEEEISQVATILEPEVDAQAVVTEDAEVEPVIHDRADQVFTIFAILVGVAGVVIAILLGMAIRVQHDVSSQRSPHP